MRPNWNRRSERPPGELNDPVRQRQAEQPTGPRPQSQQHPQTAPPQRRSPSVSVWWVLAFIVAAAGVVWLLADAGVVTFSGSGDAVEDTEQVNGLTVVTDSRELREHISLEETRDHLVAAGLLHSALRHIINQQQSVVINECGGVAAVREALLLAVPPGYGRPQLGLSFPGDRHPLEWNDDTGGDTVSGHITVDCAVVRTR